MKRQIVIIISLALVSFLAGTLFDINYLVAGSDGNPWDKAWTTISSLQAQVQSLNASVETLKTQISLQPKMIRFVNEAEFVVEEDTYVNLTTFTWTPNNSSNNAILSATSYAEVKCEPTGLWYIDYRVLITTKHGIQGGLSAGSQTYWFENYTWTRVSTWVLEHGVSPNQPNYNLTFQAELSTGGVAPIPSGAKAYFKNINIILTVADGLPANG